MVIAVVAIGAAGTLGYGYARSSFGRATDGQNTADGATASGEAVQLGDDLRAQLTTAAYSQGEKAGSPHTEGDFAALAQHDGGILLAFSSGTSASEPGGAVHVADVMLGLMPPAASGSATGAGQLLGQDGTGTAPGAGPADVSCYRYTFGNFSYTIKQSVIACPASRPDGQPGSAEAWLGGLLAVQPTRTDAAPARYPLSTTGAREYLAEDYVFPPEAAVSQPPKLSTAHGGGVFAAAFRNDGACFYLRMSAGAESLWLAPVDAQVTGCTGKAALAASGRYGIDAAAEG